MSRIILSGANGKMGGVIAELVAERADCTIVAGFDRACDYSGAFPIYSNLLDCKEDADVIIDFSHPDALAPLLSYAKEKHLPIVVATTGLSENHIELIKEASQDIPVFFSMNMSLGVNLLLELIAKATAVLGNEFDIEIIEKHHNLKVDAPSGTAVMLANKIAEALPYTPNFVYERESKRERRSKNEIGIHSVRGGTIVGEHEILFAGKDETISLTHTAYSKNIFAVGAVNAGLFLTGKQKGLYSMKDLI